MPQHYGGPVVGTCVGSARKQLMMEYTLGPNGTNGVRAILYIFTQTMYERLTIFLISSTSTQLGAD